MNPYRGNEGLVEQVFEFAYFARSGGSIHRQIQKYINEKRQNGFYLSSHAFARDVWVDNENHVEFTFVFDKI